MVVENDFDRGVGGVGGVEELEKFNKFTTAVAFLIYEVRTHTLRPGTVAEFEER
jgi:hypothetical protein